MTFLMGRYRTPTGIASYRPYHATGEDFLHNFLGMIGIPIDLFPTYPAEAQTILLTEAAKADPKIVEEMKQSLMAGKTVVMTSGLLRALEGKGIDDLVELRYNPSPVGVTSFIGAFGPGAGTELGSTAKPILFPQVRFYTNDAWPVIRGISDDNLFPLLLSDNYGAGHLFVLTVPDNQADLYELPEPTLNALRNYVMGGAPVRLEAPARVSLMTYDNGALIVESFRDEPAQVTVLADARTLTNLQTGEVVNGTAVPVARHEAHGPDAGAKMEFKLTVQPHSYLAFQQAK